jgi:hypothetical protein
MSDRYDLVATAGARYRTPPSLPIVVVKYDIRNGEDKKDGLQGTTLKRHNNVSMFYHRSPGNDYRG